MLCRKLLLNGTTPRSKCFHTMESSVGSDVTLVCLRLSMTCARIAAWPIQDHSDPKQHAKYVARLGFGWKEQGSDLANGFLPCHWDQSFRRCIAILRL